MENQTRIPKFEQEIMMRERELDAEGHPRLSEWINQGKLWAEYPTGYDNKKLRELKPEAREQLAKFHQRAAQYHQDQAFHYHKYMNGDPDSPAKIQTIDEM